MRSVVVTGGTTRLGAAIAEHRETLGWYVIRSSHRNDAGADIVVDLSRRGGAEELYAAAVSLLGGKEPDALVNNAALFALDDTDVMALNYNAPKRLIELMAERQKTGAVVNILDSRILNHAPSTPYEKSKASLRDCTVEYARRYSEVLRVNAVAPGPVLAPVDVHEPAGSTPLGRPTPGDVAAAVAFLLEARATTGCIIPVDGGQAV
ncbi:MAG: SDR family oxidoreductase [Kiritimatiellae bacterium]|nr:SDR family oxidoreductase [Kiritimatiellia bacterium]